MVRSKKQTTTFVPVLSLLTIAASTSAQRLESPCLLPETPLSVVEDNLGCASNLPSSARSVVCCGETMTGLNFSCSSPSRICDTALTFLDAESQCSAIGQRLCSRSELLSNECCSVLPDCAESSWTAEDCPTNINDTTLTNFTSVVAFPDIISSAASSFAIYVSYTVHGFADDLAIKVTFKDDDAVHSTMILPINNSAGTVRIVIELDDEPLAADSMYKVLVFTAPRSNPTWDAKFARDTKDIQVVHTATLSPSNTPTATATFSPSDVPTATTTSTSLSPSVAPTSAPFASTRPTTPRVIEDPSYTASPTSAPIPTTTPPINIRVVTKIHFPSTGWLQTDTNLFLTALRNHLFDLNLSDNIDWESANVTTNDTEVVVSFYTMSEQSWASLRWATLEQRICIVEVLSDISSRSPMVSCGQLDASKVSTSTIASQTPTNTGSDTSSGLSLLAVILICVALAFVLILAAVIRWTLCAAGKRSDSRQGLMSPGSTPSISSSRASSTREFQYVSAASAQLRSESPIYATASPITSRLSTPSISRTPEGAPRVSEAIAPNMISNSPQYASITSTSTSHLPPTPPARTFRKPTREAPLPPGRRPTVFVKPKNSQQLSQKYFTPSKRKLSESPLSAGSTPSLLGTDTTYDSNEIIMNHAVV